MTGQETGRGCRSHWPGTTPSTIVPPSSTSVPLTITFVPTSGADPFTGPTCIQLHRPPVILCHDRKSLDIGTVTLNKGARVSGTVRHDGKPVAGAVVFLHVRENERVFSLFSRTVTDKEGRFAISDAVAPGSYALSAWRPTAGPVQSFADLRKSRSEFAVKGTKPHGVDLTLPGSR